MTDLGWGEVLAGVNARVGGTFALSERLSGGRQGGAYVVTEPGRRAVLTWRAHPGLAARREETVALVQRLRDRGYPAPTWIDAGVLTGDVTFELSEMAAGRHVGFDRLPLDRLLEAVELQADLAEPSATTWNDHAWSVVRDPRGPRAQLARLGAAGARLNRLLDDGLRRTWSARLPVGDAVHGDLGTYNVLVDEGGAIAVIDLGACGPGTRALDYAWLLREAHHAQAPAPTLGRIRSAGEAVAGREAFHVCLMAAATEMVAFSVRAGAPDAALAQARRAEELLDPSQP